MVGPYYILSAIQWVFLSTFRFGSWWGVTLSSSGTEGSGGGYYRILDFAVDNLG